jgi:hypothetical protein
MNPMRIDKAWTFYNGAWENGPEHELSVPDDLRRQDGDAIQGHHYAFNPTDGRTTFRARFQIRLGGHTDAGLIFGAKDAGTFRVLHFPECGQAYRAQHFWAALSHMDGDGWLRTDRMELVRRVSSTNRLWHDIDATVDNGKLSVLIDGLGTFEADDPSLGEPGALGVYLFAAGQIRDVRIAGAEANVAFDRTITPAVTWFNPCPDTDYGKWQRPSGIVRAPGSGDLILNYNVTRGASDGVTQLTTRSSDGGRTWDKPQPMDGLKVGDWDGWGAVHVYPDGQLRMLISGEDASTIATTADDGNTWEAPEPIQLPATPEGLSRIYPGPMLNCSDGSIVMIGYGRHESSLPAESILMWGSHHCQAFTSRSEDNGRTWSPWVNLDGTDDGEGNLAGGSLDLTEVCVAEVASGRLTALIRPIYSPWMWETWSHDTGRTWSPCVRGPFPGYATSNMLRTSSGVLLVAHRLPGCAVHASWDGGVTWDPGTMIDSAIWVMGGMIEVEPDVVLYVYYDSFESLMRGQFIRVGDGRLEPQLR